MDGATAGSRPQPGTIKEEQEAIRASFEALPGATDWALLDYAMDRCLSLEDVRGSLGAAAARLNRPVEEVEAAARRTREIADLVRTEARLCLRLQDHMNGIAPLSAKLQESYEESWGAVRRSIEALQELNAQTSPTGLNGSRLAAGCEQPLLAGWLPVGRGDRQVLWALHCPVRSRPQVLQAPGQLRPGAAATLGCALLVQAARSTWQQATAWLRAPRR